MTRWRISPSGSTRHRTRQALTSVLRTAKRNKAFESAPFIGLALDGTTVGRCREKGCDLCRPYRNATQEIIGYRHSLAMISVVGAGIALPFDVEPYGPGDSEYAAAQRLLRRAIPALNVRFADYIVVDAGLSTATFLHTATEAGLPVMARLKENLPELAASVEQRFGSQPPHRILTEGKDRVELWDADDFDPWETLQWPTVRVVRYRLHKPDGTVVQGDWLTSLPSPKFPSLSVFRMGRSRWEIENEGFNDCKSRQGFDHICHHDAKSLVICWLLTLLALVVGRLFRIRHLHRGKHPIRTAADFVRLLWLSLGRNIALNSS
jgi:Transposase DDE domain